MDDAIGVDVLTDPMTRQRLYETASQIRHEVSTTHIANCNLPYVTANANGVVHYKHQYTEFQYNSLMESHVQLVAKICEDAVKLFFQKNKQKSIDSVIIIGASCEHFIACDV